MSKVLRIWGLPVLFFTLMDGVLLQWTHRHNSNTADDRVASETVIDLPIQVLRKVLQNDSSTVSAQMWFNNETLLDDKQRQQKKNVNTTVMNPYSFCTCGLY